MDDVLKIEQTLKSRAQALANVPTPPIDREQSLEVVQFLLGRETYAIESKYILEVRALTELTPLPFTPAFVLGIINVRGQIFSVVNLKSFLNLTQQGISDLDKIILLQSPHMEYGILADKILGVFFIPQDSVQAGLTTITGVNAEYFKGVTSQHVIILDGEKLLAEKNMVVFEE
jgi:purine-binding chemotaxis protein CheW